MNTIKSFLSLAHESLRAIYQESEEIQAVAQCLLMDILSCTQTDLLMMGKDTSLSDERWGRLLIALDRLSAGEPLQYILGHAYFMHLDLAVAPGVLIPRPETEELVMLIVEDAKRGLFTSRESGINVLDVGTGSGCIPIALASLLDPAQVRMIRTIDVSSEALMIAQTNIDTISHAIPIIAEQQDLFTLPEIAETAAYDLIVSNPPYIHPSEAESMTSQVLDWEPHKALFAPERQPTLFYDEIATLVQKGYLKAGGRIYLEINPLYASSTLERMIERIGQERIHEAEILHDITGKLRFIRIVLKM